MIEVLSRSWPRRDGKTLAVAWLPEVGAIAYSRVGSGSSGMTGIRRDRALRILEADTEPDLDDMRGQAVTFLLPARAGSRIGDVIEEAIKHGFNELRAGARSPAIRLRGLPWEANFDLCRDEDCGVDRDQSPAHLWIYARVDVAHGEIFHLNLHTGAVVPPSPLVVSR